MFWYWLFTLMIFLSLAITLLRSHLLLPITPPLPSVILDASLNYFLGVEVIHNETMLHLNQHKYIQDILTRTNMLDSKPAGMPGMLGKTLSQHDGALFLDTKLDCSTIGAFQYVTLTRPDIAFVVKNACQFMANPTEVHWLTVKRILRYLQGTSTYGLLLHQHNPLIFKGI